MRFQKLKNVLRNPFFSIEKIALNIFKANISMAIRWNINFIFSKNIFLTKRNMSKKRSKLKKNCFWNFEILPMIYHWLLPQKKCRHSFPKCINHVHILRSRRTIPAGHFPNALIICFSKHVVYNDLDDPVQHGDVVCQWH